MRPNLFKWATTELSQDAFICWFIEWAHPEYKEEPLNKYAGKLIEELSGIRHASIEKLEVKRQYKNIDILVKINGDKAILIEDKVHSKSHGNQLTRYAKLLSKEFEKENISLVYFKTGDQSNYRRVEEKGYRAYKRKDFLKLLKSGKEEGIRNEVYLDFLYYLNNINSSVNSYQDLPIENWHWNSWKGFYIELQNKLGQGEWDYVPQKNGGFLGFWWNWDHWDYKNTGFDYYLQLEHRKFCFKISPDSVEKNYEIREFYRQILFPKASACKVEIRKNGRCVKGKTKTMTVAKLDYDYIKTNSNGLIDMEATVEGIIRIQKMINELRTAYNSG